MRYITLTLAAAALAMAAGQLQAQHHSGWDSFWHRTGVDYHRMNAFPEPFVYADRAAAREPFRIMVANGWQMQNTLGNQYFHSETQQLTRAGELKVRWIATQAPQQYRTVYVLRGSNLEATSVRVDSVQQAVARVVTSGPLPPVVETDTSLYGRPGQYVDDTYRKAQASQPAPVLPTAAAAVRTSNANTSPTRKRGKSRDFPRLRVGLVSQSSANSKLCSTQRASCVDVDSGGLSYLMRTKTQS